LSLNRLNFEGKFNSAYAQIIGPSNEPIAGGPFLIKSIEDVVRVRSLANRKTLSEGKIFKIALLVGVGDVLVHAKSISFNDEYWAFTAGRIDSLERKAYKINFKNEAA
jgi:hypothetical protein